MAEIMGWPLNLVSYGYNAEDVMRWMAGKTSGVYGQEGNYQVMHQEDMTITVKSAGMLGGWLSNMGKYGIAFWNGTDITLTVPVGDGVNPRIDRVIVSWHIPNQTELPKVIIRTGTPSATPEPPELVNDGEYAEICLAEISVVAGTVALTQSDITDTRMDEELCGLVSMGIDKIPTATYQQQFDEWFETLEYTLSGDVAGNLFTLINQRVKLVGDTMTGPLNFPGGSVTGALTVSPSTTTSAIARGISLTTTDLEAGVTSLSDGEICLVYE